jgi:hypothetical protein
MSEDLTTFGHFYSGFYVESICLKCFRTVAKASTRAELEPYEKLHDCSDGNLEDVANGS